MANSAAMQNMYFQPKPKRMTVATAMHNCFLIANAQQVATSTLIATSQYFFRSMLHILNLWAMLIRWC